MIVGAGYCLGSLAVGGPLAGVPARRLIINGFLATAILVGLAFSGRTGTPGAIICITGVALMMGVEGVAMTTLLTSETPSGAGTTMTLSGSLFNLGAAGGSAIGGALLSGKALALGFPVFALGAAVLCWRPTRVRALSIDSRGMRKEHGA